MFEWICMNFVFLRKHKQCSLHNIALQHCEYSKYIYGIVEVQTKALKKTDEKYVFILEKFDFQKFEIFKNRKIWKIRKTKISEKHQKIENLEKSDFPPKSKRSKILKNLIFPSESKKSENRKSWKIWFSLQNRKSRFVLIFRFSENLKIFKIWKSNFSNVKTYFSSGFFLLTWFMLLLSRKCI